VVAGRELDPALASFDADLLRHRNEAQAKLVDQYRASVYR
jgi:hypothetical protein